MAPCTSASASILFIEGKEHLALVLAKMSNIKFTMNQQVLIQMQEKVMGCSKKEREITNKAKAETAWGGYMLCFQKTLSVSI